jgi:DNA-binding LacI/PurR family transcriptional regulator
MAPPTGYSWGVLTEERRARIAAELQAGGAVEVRDLAERFDVSVVTIRRDLAVVVASSPPSRRVRGGAVREPARAAPKRSRARDTRHDGAGALIGIVVPARDYYYRAVVDGAHDEADRLGLRLLLGISDYSRQDEVTLVERMLARGVDALLVTPARTQAADARIYRLLAEARVPVVLIEREVPDPFSGIESVHTDHALGMAAAMRHLIALGHRRVGLAMRPHNPTGPWLRAGMALASGEAGPSVLTYEHTVGPGIGEAYTRSLREVLDAVRAAGESAVVVLSDHEAVDLAAAAPAAGLRVPQDLAIVAYDDERAADAMVPLTAVAPPKRDLGRVAVRMCADRFTERDAPADEALSPRRQVLLPTLRVRASTTI